MKSHSKLPWILTTLATAVAVVAVLHSSGVLPLPHIGNVKAATGQQSHQRKILYWYAPMNPSYHSDRPGKSPMGMDLVPKYADEDPPTTPQDQQNAAAGKRKILYWYDPMMPGFHSDHPGKSPMGMEMIPKYASEGTAKMAPGTVKISYQQQQMIGVRTSVIKRGDLVRTIRTTGYVVPDQTKLAHIHVKVNGWIEKAYVNFVGQMVKKGQPLFTVYSPSLVSTQEEYLLALKGERDLGNAPYLEVANGAASLLRATRERLRLWDISDAQIKELQKTGKVQRTMTFYSPVTGFVMDRQAYPQSAVGPDKDLYTVADLSDVWVDADVYEYELPYIQVGQQASMQLSYYPGKTYRGTVTYIYPTVDPQTRTAKVRLDFPNPNFDLKPHMFANVELHVNYGNHVLVPAEAVLDSGTRMITFLAKGNGYFEPREIKVGPRVDDQYIVLSGLKPGDTVVTSGNFMIDSDSDLNTVISDTSSQSH